MDERIVMGNSALNPKMMDYDSEEAESDDFE